MALRKHCWSEYTFGGKPGRLVSIANVLMEELIETLNGYDPDYKGKIKQVVEAIQNELSKQRQFSADDVGRHVEFACTRHLRVLARGSFVEVVPGGKYGRTSCWPPPAAYLTGVPIGVAYYVQRWFRYGLQDWITKRMWEQFGRTALHIPDHNGGFKDRQGALSRLSPADSQRSMPASKRESVFPRLLQRGLDCR